METHENIYSDLTGGFRKRSTARHGHEVRPLGTYVNGNFSLLMDDTGLGTAQWITQSKSTPTWDTSSANVPAGPDWTPYARNLDFNQVKMYHGVSYAEKMPYFAYPGVPWMWGDQNARIANVVPRFPHYRRPYREVFQQSVTLHKNFCEVRHNELIDKDGFAVPRPLTWNVQDDAKWKLLTSSLAGFTIENVNRRSGAIEFLFQMEVPNAVNEHFSEERLAPEALPVIESGERKEREHTMEIMCGDSASPVSFTFGIHGENGWLHADRATTDIIRMTEQGVPAHYVVGIRGGMYSEELRDVMGSGFTSMLAPIRGVEGDVVEFEWGKWYRFRIEWQYGRQPDGTLDVRYRMFYGDPRERLRRAYFRLMARSTFDEHEGFRYFVRIDEYTSPLVDKWSGKELLEHIKEASGDDPIVEYAEELFEELTGEDGRLHDLWFLNGFEYPSPAGQRFHLARLGASWDPDYIEYGTTTELVQDPYPAVLEVAVDADVHDEDIIIEVEYLPAYFREYGTLKTSLGKYDVKRHSISIHPKIFTFTIPAFTRRGRLFQGPADVGQIMSVKTSGGNGIVSVYAIIGDGAKIIHAVKPMDAIETLYFLRQSISKGPRLCPRCGGLDDECPVCLGKKFRKEDSEIPEFMLDDILHYHGAPSNKDTPRDAKLGMCMAISNMVNPVPADIRDLFARLVDVDPTSIRLTRYSGNQSVLITISVPRGRGPNALLSSLAHLQWVAETLRPPGVEYVVTFSEVDESEAIIIEDTWGLKW